MTGKASPFLPALFHQWRQDFEKTSLHTHRECPLGSHTIQGEGLIPNVTPKTVSVHLITATEVLLLHAPDQQDTGEAISTGRTEGLLSLLHVPTNIAIVLEELYMESYGYRPIL